MYSNRLIPDGKIKIDQSYDGYRVKISYRRSYSTIGFLCIWLAGWAIGEVMVAKTLLYGEAKELAAKGFMLVWLAGWTIGGIFAIRQVLLMLFGHHIIRISPGQIGIAEFIGQWGKFHEYEMASIQNLRLLNEDESGKQYLHKKKAKTFGIEFEYKGGPVRFATGLDRNEAEAFFEWMKECGYISKDKFLTAEVEKNEDKKKNGFEDAGKIGDTDELKDKNDDFYYFKGE
ncbi:MAG: hypothetical protein K8T10_18420 [Candidatus Eremiobacteraeota bacterium]|nr:hypothetical protein [Candidatus Eremiobacteraeota bacterium]